MARKRSAHHRLRKHRRRLYRIDPHCHYCGVLLTWLTSTVDHKLPLAKGGTNTKDNLVLSCSKCNAEKGDKGYWEFKRPTPTLFCVSLPTMVDTT